jgi:hypothetical protein
MKGLRHLEFPIPVVHGLEIIGEHRCRRAGGLETVIGEYGNPHDMDGDVSSADLPQGGHDDAHSIETHRTARRGEKDQSWDSDGRVEGGGKRRVVLDHEFSTGVVFGLVETVATEG